MPYVKLSYVKFEITITLVPFQKGDYASSIDCYTRGMQMDPSNPILPANRAMALLKQGMAAAAEADCTIALRYNTLEETFVSL